MRKIIEYVLVSTDGVYEDPVGMMRVGEYQDEAYLRDVSARVDKIFAGT